MRNLGLDLLRFVAVLLVLGRHLSLPDDASEILVVWRRGGWVGVDLFFVLSGFLVSGLLFKEFQREGRLDIKRFLIRRGFKIYPAFYVMIIFTLIFMKLTDREILAHEVVGELFFLQNYLGGLWNHTWSLAVEEHFYLGIAFLFFILMRRFRTQRGDTVSHDPFRSLPLIFLVLAVVCLGFRMLNLALFSEFNYYWFAFRTHIRIDSLFFGVLIAYLWYFRELEKHIARVPKVVLVLAGILFLVPAFVYALDEYLWISVFGVILFYVGSGLLLLGFISIRSTDHALLRMVGYLGTASYSIYLWHMPVGAWAWRFIVKQTGVDSFPLYCLFYLVGSVVFGLMMNKLLEQPTLRLRERLFPSR